MHAISHISIGELKHNYETYGHICLHVIWSFFWCPEPQNQIHFICKIHTALQWHHDEHDCVSNHQPCDCLLNRLFRHRWKKITKFRVTGLCAGNSSVTGEFPVKWPVTRKMFSFDDVIMQFQAWNNYIVGLVQFGLFQWHFIAFMLLAKVLHLWKCNVMRLNYNFKCQRKINCNINAVLRIISECLCVSKMSNPLYYTELIILCTNHKEFLCNWH